MNKKQITANLGQDALYHKDSQVPKTTVSVPMGRGDDKVWVPATMTGQLAEKFKDATQGQRITVSGDLKTVKDQKGNDKLVMDVDRAYNHKSVNLEATVKKEPSLGANDNSPATVFAIAKTDGKDVIINVAEFKNKEDIMALKKGDKIQIEGDAKIMANNNPRPGTHDFKYEVVNPKINGKERDKSVDQETTKAADKPGPTKDVAKPKTQTPEIKAEFIAATDHHSLFKVGKQYEVISGSGEASKLESVSTNRKEAISSLKTMEENMQKANGVEKPKVKASTKTTREYPPTVDRSAVKAEKNTSKKRSKGLEV